MHELWGSLHECWVLSSRDLLIFGDALKVVIASGQAARKEFDIPDEMELKEQYERDRVDVRMETGRRMCAEQEDGIAILTSSDGKYSNE